MEYFIQNEQQFRDALRPLYPENVDRFLVRAPCPECGDALLAHEVVGRDLHCRKCACVVRAGTAIGIAMALEKEGFAPNVRVHDMEAEANALLRLFEPIVGYDDVKDLFYRSITADAPVHILLEGPPASAKTLFLTELGTLPGAYFAVGAGSTRAGLTQALLTYMPTYLLVDEIESIGNPKDYAALNHLMENEEVVETKYGRHVRVPLRTWVFAAGNDVSRLPSALLSRFGGLKGVVRFKEYAPGEFLEIATSVLVKREDREEGFARKVAETTLQVLGSRDVRLAVRIARLARDEGGLEQVVRTMQRRR